MNSPVIYDVGSGDYGILVSNDASDSWTRSIYHNTIDVASSLAVLISSGNTDLKNNIGPASTDNLATNSAYFVSIQEGSEDYHLIKDSAPIDAGADLTGIVANDLEGNSRSIGSAPDVGAYEYVDNDAPSPPRNLRLVK